MNASQRDYDCVIRPIEDAMIQSIWRVTRDPDDAEEAMQNALLTIWRQWNRVRAHANPRALVLRICLDSAYDAIRKRVRHESSREGRGVDESVTDDECQPIESLMAKEHRTQIIHAIGRLSRQQAVATLMRVVQGQPYDHIASALNCTEATARKHVARGRDKLRVALAHLDPDNDPETKR